MRLIDADNYKSELLVGQEYLDEDTLLTAINVLDCQPTIDAVPAVQTPCDFCSKWDWGEAAAVVDNGKYAHIHLAGGSYRFPADKQFNYCPVCGYPNPYKERKDGEG